MGYDVKIERNLLHALFDLKGSFKDLNSYLQEHISSLPEEPNSYVAHGTWKILYLGINHWILLAPIEEERDLLELLKPENCPESISIVLISDTLKFFRINGVNADDIMSIASPLNLNTDVFKNNDATFSEVFGLKALIMRDGDGYQFGIDQSFGDMISDYLDLTIAT